VKSHISHLNLPVKLPTQAVEIIQQDGAGGVRPPPLKMSKNLVKYNKTVWCPDDTFPYQISVTECCDWKLVDDPFNATMFWTISKRDMVENWKQVGLGNGRMWNQIPSGGMMTDKSRLHELLVAINATEYQPETFVLTNKDECKQFFSGPAKNKETIWVTKDPLSAEGDGIVVNPNIDALRELWLKNPKAEKDEDIVCRTDVTTDSVVIQRYILNPLLLNGKKMEIRTYWLMASVEPFIVFYRDGTVRLTTRDYRTGEWEDPLIHITNVKQQKKADPEYYNTESERKWNLEKLSEYVVEKGLTQSTSEEWLVGLRNKLKEIIGRVARGAHPQLMKNKGNTVWDGRFELFGMDVILDEHLRPWLTEIQDGPSLSLDPGTKRKVIPEMLEELTDIMLEIDYGHRFNNHNIPPIQSTGKWEYIISNF
jgi:hypothetical protein